MNKIVFLFVAYLTTTLASAQTITDQTIAGNWKMSGFDIEGINWDFKTDVLTLPAEITDAAEGQDMEAIMAEMKESLAGLKEGYIYIMPNKRYEQMLMGEKAAGNYTIAYEDGQHYFDIENDDSGIVDRLGLDIIDGRMHISMPDDEVGMIILMFDKSK